MNHGLLQIYISMVVFFCLLSNHVISHDVLNLAKNRENILFIWKWSELLTGSYLINKPIPFMFHNCHFVKINRAKHVS